MRLYTMWATVQNSETTWEGKKEKTTENCYDFVFELNSFNHLAFPFNLWNEIANSVAHDKIFEWIWQPTKIYSIFLLLFFHFVSNSRKPTQCACAIKGERQGKEYNDAYFIISYIDREAKKMTIKQQSPHSLKLVFEIVAFVPNISSVCAECRVPSSHSHAKCIQYLHLVLPSLFRIVAGPFARILPNGNHMGKERKKNSTIYRALNIMHIHHTPYIVYSVERSFSVYCNISNFIIIIEDYKLTDSLTRYTLHKQARFERNVQNVWFCEVLFYFPSFSLHYYLVFVDCSMHVGILFGRSSVFSFVATYVWHCCPFGIIPCCCVFSVWILLFYLIFFRKRKRRTFPKSRI